MPKENPAERAAAIILRKHARHTEGGPALTRRAIEDIIIDEFAPLVEAAGLALTAINEAWDGQRFRFHCPRAAMVLFRNLIERTRPLDESLKDLTALIE